jgi:hypothetical protein
MAETLPYIGFQEFQRLRDGHAFYDRNVNKKVGRSFWRGSPDLIQLWWSKRRLWLGLAFFSRFAGEMTAYNVLALSLNLMNAVSPMEETSTRNAAGFVVCAMPEGGYPGPQCSGKVQSDGFPLPQK